MSQSPIECSVCGNQVPDAGDIVCVDCYEAGRGELPDPVTLRLSRSDCDTILGYLMSKKNLTDLRIRFFNALEGAAKERVAIGQVDAAEALLAAPKAPGDMAALPVRTAEETAGTSKPAAFPRSDDPSPPQAASSTEEGAKHRI